MRKTLDLADPNKERTAREQIEADSWYQVQPAPKIRKFKLQTRYPHKRSEGLTHRNALRLHHLTKGNRRVFLSPSTGTNPMNESEDLVIEYQGEFWTGNRFSKHIGEAMLCEDMKQANQTVAWIRDRLAIRANIIETPSNDYLDD